MFTMRIHFAGVFLGSSLYFHFVFSCFGVLEGLDRYSTLMTLTTFRTIIPINSLLNTRFTPLWKFQMSQDPGVLIPHRLSCPICLHLHRRFVSFPYKPICKDLQQIAALRDIAEKFFHGFFLSLRALILGGWILEKWREDTLGKSPPLITNPQRGIRIEIRHGLLFILDRFSTSRFHKLFMPRPPWLLDAGNFFTMIHVCRCQ